RSMVATYTSKRGRRFRYYICQTARQNGWASCPTKSVAATMIEDSVVAQLRTALSNADTRQQLQVADADWQLLQADPGGPVSVVVERILFDGTTAGGSLTLGSGGRRV